MKKEVENLSEIEERVVEKRNQELYGKKISCNFSEKCREKHCEMIAKGVATICSNLELRKNNS